LTERTQHYVDMEVRQLSSQNSLAILPYHTHTCWQYSRSGPPTLRTAQGHFWGDVLSRLSLFHSFMHPLCHKRADASNRAMVGIPFLLVVYFSGPLDWDAGTRDGPLLDNFYLDCSYPLLDEIQFLSHSSGHVYKTISGHRPPIIDSRFNALAVFCVCDSNPRAAR